jgi:fatty-acyl-CoA synthase
VESAQAVGVPDPKFGEEVCVWIRLRRGATVTADEIRLFCKSRLAYFKVPRYVKFVDEFPLTVTGKVQKFRIREKAIEKYGLGPGHGDVAFDDKTEGDAASSPGARDEQA